MHIDKKYKDIFIHKHTHTHTRTQMHIDDNFLNHRKRQSNCVLLPVNAHVHLYNVTLCYKL